jgi:hypothetical protein
MLLINISNIPIETICRWGRHSPLFLNNKKLENAKTNKQTHQLPKREIKQTQNKLQIFQAK